MEACTGEVCILHILIEELCGSGDSLDLPYLGDKEVVDIRASRLFPRQGIFFQGFTSLSLFSYLVFSAIKYLD